MSQVSALIERARTQESLGDLEGAALALGLLIDHLVELVGENGLSLMFFQDLIRIQEKQRNWRGAEASRARVRQIERRIYADGPLTAGGRRMVVMLTHSGGVGQPTDLEQVQPGR